MSLERKAALFGFTNTQEIVARRLMSEQNTSADAFLLIPNPHFARASRRAIFLDDNYINSELVDTLSRERYGVNDLGPILGTLRLSNFFTEKGIPHLGANPEQLRFETDKTAIFDVFPNSTGILPFTETLQEFDAERFHNITRSMTNGYVLKFVGDYNQKYKGSEVGRVRIGGETIDDESSIEFIKRSIETSGKVLVQEKIQGKDFSANYVVDRNGNLFRLGENICYKRRSEGDTGPMCDGTGSVTVDNSLPFLESKDIRFIEDKIVKPFLEYLPSATGKAFAGQLNLDLMKQLDGNLRLFEINCRAAGGHTVANLLPGIQNSFYEVLHHAQNGTLDQIQPEYKKRSSVVVSAYPEYYPLGPEEGQTLQEITITKDVPQDVHLYFGWVDILEETAEQKKLRLYNSPSILFEASDTTIEIARDKIYSTIDSIVNNQLNYRRDIGLNV